MRVNASSLLLLCIGSLIAPSYADDSATCTFILTIDAELVGVGAGESKETKDDKQLDVVPCEGAFVTFAAPSTPQKVTNGALRDWYASISKPVIPQSHSFGIKEGRISPSSLIIRSGDSIVQTEESGRIYFEGMIANPAFGVVAMPGAKYTFHRPERGLVRVLSNPNAPRGGPSREAHLFVVDHTCVAITNRNGIAKLSGLPLGVEIPMQVFYPWGEFAPKYESPTLKFEKNKFTLVCDGAESEHRIQISNRRSTAK